MVVGISKRAADSWFIAGAPLYGGQLEGGFAVL